MPLVQHLNSWWQIGVLCREVKANGQAGMSAKKDAGAPRGRVVRVERDPIRPGEKLLDRDSRLESRQGRADAEVETAAEGEVASSTARVEVSAGRPMSAWRWSVGSSPEQQHANTHRLFIKLCWLMEKHAVGTERVVNIDETSCRLLPVHQTGWGHRGKKKAQLQGNTKEATTFTIAFSMDRGPLDMLVQIVHAGKTDAVLPEQPWPEHTDHVTSENGWATTTTILQLAATLDDVLNPGKEGQSWIFCGTWPASMQARPPWPPCGPLSLMSCSHSSRHKARRTCSLATWPSSAASRAAFISRRAPLLPAPFSMAPSKPWP